ncbi:MAG: ribonucleoside triphosphate reductase [Deltaproteobacteria bacterium]|jgi:ribonucleoside-triphosphate reductase|nr:ribonucleoside triphosphate reductase [Deltaproteobacteria bacterium]
MSRQQIRKREGQLVPFEEAKITQAILKAGAATGEFGEEAARDITLRVLHKMGGLSESEVLDVEATQDMVETSLSEAGYHRTSKAYILYRAQRAHNRALAKAGFSATMDSYLNNLDWMVKENSNMGYSLQGLNNFIASGVTSRYWLHDIYSERVRAAHESGDLHLHDLNLLSVYCVGWDLYDLLKEGFKGISGNVESAPPRHLRSALGQLVNFFYTLQGEAAGAQAVSSFDTLLAPFIRADGLSYKGVRQAFQEFMFNINIPTRVGFQTPFTNITMDLTPPKAFRDKPVLIGGEPQDTTYGDYQEEMDTLNRAFAEVMMEGDAKGRVFTFPIPTYNIGKDFDWANPNLEPIWRMTGHYGIPYFSNFVNSDMDPDDARSMCCRLRLDNRLLRKRGGGLFGANPLTGSVGVVTINLPRIGYLSADEGEFLERLDTLMDIAKESLVTKRKELERFTDGGLYPYTRFYLRSVKSCTGRYWSNHFSTIGLVGANEAAMNLFGKTIATDQGRAFALRVLNHMRDRLASFQEETGDFFNLEATPAEGCSYRLARLDREYPGMIFANGAMMGFKPNGEKEFIPFYTNSTHLPVDHTDDLFEALSLQDELQQAYTGGTVLHSFIGEEISDPFLVRDLVRKITNNFRLPYFTLTPTFSVCPNHGYLKGEEHVCPECGAKSDVYSRVVGYLRPVTRWNEGKRKEFGMRRVYSVGKGSGASSDKGMDHIPRGAKRAARLGGMGAPGRTAKTVDA